MFSQENTPVRVGLLELLMNSQGSQYVIPAYQRNYTWTAAKEVNQLYEDLKEVLNGTYTQHFIGIMIYLEKPLDPFTRERAIIDGQQRLTTIFLALYAIKDLLLERGFEEEAQQLEHSYLINPLKKDIKFKLKPLVADDLVYQKIVTGDFDSITETESNVYKNYLFFKKKFTELSNKYSLTNDILLAINKLYLVCVPITEKDYPQKIFESINATGAKLTASDLIRNFILMPIESNTQDEYYNRYWKKLECLVSANAKQLESFFRFFLMAKNRAIVNKTAAYYAFTAWYKETVDDLGIEGVFKEIVAYAQYFNDLYVRDVHELEMELRKPLLEFRRILSDMPAPLMLELYAIHSKKDESGNALISSTALGQIITIVNSYLMRRALAGMDTSDISRYFPTLLKEVLSECNGKYSNIVEIFKKNLVNRNRGNSQQMPDDKTVRDRILNSNMYNLRFWLQLFLQKLESKDNPAPVDFSKLSIEHLMPQTATAEWYSALGVDKDTYDRNVHRLGNLTLAARPDNSKMGNKVWEYKNKVLASTSHLKINEAILAKEQWTIADIDSRTDSLIQSIFELYPYCASKTADIFSVPIFIQNDDAYAIALYYPDNGNVEIEAGSTLNMSFATPEVYPEIEELRQQLFDDGIIAPNADGNLEFQQSYTFYPRRAKSTALSIAASVIMHGNKNGWEWWCAEDGKTMNETEYKQA